LVSVSATLFDENSLVHDDALIAHINSSGASWTAGKNARFEGMTFGDAKKLVGTKMNRPLNEDWAPHADLRLNAIPTEFDGRTQWPSCIHPVRDQQQCGSCWAFGATEALSDRICIAGGPNVILSPQDLVSCNSGNYGCDGGYLDVAWQYMASTGVELDSAFPYTSGGGVAPPCGDHMSVKPRYYAKAVKSYGPAQATIQTELMTNGPLEVAFNVYQDFFNYKSGVYTHKTGGLAGGHAVKAIGWGVLNGVPYWLIMNSWGTSWGAQGLFMIKRGTNECGIESNVIGGAYDSSKN